MSYDPLITLIKNEITLARTDNARLEKERETATQEYEQALGRLYGFSWADVRETARQLAQVSRLIEQNTARIAALEKQLPRYELFDGVVPEAAPVAS